MKYAIDLDQPDSWCCVPTTAVTAIDAATAGQKRPGIEQLRTATGVPHPTGISYGAIAKAALDVSVVVLQPRYGLSRGETAQLAPGGFPHGISVDMAKIGYARSGGHTIFVHDYSVWPGGGTCSCEKRSSARHSEFTVQDPGTWSVGFFQMSADRLFTAAEARTAGHGINVLVAPDTEDVYRMGTGIGSARLGPSTKSRATRKLGKRLYHVMSIVRGEEYTTPAGHKSRAWYRTQAGDYIRGDRLGTRNLEKPA